MKGREFERKKMLLGELVDGFRNGACLLIDTDWLSKHSVTLSECTDLSDLIANAIEDKLVGPWR